MPTTDLSRAHDLITGHRGNVMVISDMDGVLAPLTDRTGAKCFEDGTWSRDAVVPCSIQKELYRGSFKVVMSVLTGGSGMRGVKLTSSSIPENRRRLVVVGNDGADYWSRKEQTVKLRPDFEGAALIVRRFAGEVAALGLPIEPEYKGLVTSFDFAGRDQETTQSIIDALKPIAEKAKDNGIDALLDTVSNMNFTLRPSGVNKGLAGPRLVGDVEQELGTSMDVVVFLGDGGTDLEAVKGLRDLQRARAGLDKPFELLTFAVMNDRGLNEGLAQECDFVIRGAGVKPLSAGRHSEHCNAVGVSASAMGGITDFFGMIRDRSVSQAVLRDVALPQQVKMSGPNLA